MSYSEVTKRIETYGLETTLLSLFHEADKADKELIQLEQKLTAVRTNKAIAATNLEDFVTALSRRDEYKEYLRQEGSKSIVRGVSKNFLYVVEVDKTAPDLVIRWNKYPVLTIEK